MKHLNDFNYQPVPFRSITPQWIENFKKYLLENCSVNSAACYYDTIKACLNIAVKEGMINQNPCKKVDIIIKKKVERTFLTIEEVTKLDKTECRDNRVKRAFLFACFTGLRYSDVDKLRWNQIQGSFLHFTSQKPNLHLQYHLLSCYLLGLL